MISQKEGLHRDIFFRFLGNLGEFFGYLSASIIGLLVDTGVLIFLVEIFKVNHLFAAAVGFVSGAWVVYLISARKVFSHHNVRNMKLEFIIFLGLGCGGMLLTVCIMWIGTQKLGLDYRLTKFGAAIASFLCNFAMRKLVLFSKR
jgi:putative flippase GtrA